PGAGPSPRSARRSTGPLPRRRASARPPCSAPARPPRGAPPAAPARSRPSRPPPPRPPRRNRPSRSSEETSATTKWCARRNSMNAQLASGAPRLLSPARATAMCLAILLSAGSALAQSLTVPNLPHAMAGAAPASASSEANASEIALLVGRSTLINVGTHITRVSLTSPDVADALVTSPSQLLVHGKTPGTISLFVWDRAGGIRRYDVVVRRDLSGLVDQMRTLSPGEEITVHSNGKDLVISGTVKSKYVVDKAAEVAAGYVEKKDDVVNLLRVQEGIASNQVLLRVRFAEVSRSAMTELGASFFANGTKDGRWFGRTGTQQFPGPIFEEGKLVFSDFLNLFLFDAKNSIGG